MPKVQKMPAIMFYTGDWLKDPAVRMLTLSQRGLWIDMLSLMYESSDRGFLALKNGQPVSNEQLSRMVGARIEQVEECLHQMEEVGVFSRTKDGVIYSRRMVNDEKIREQKVKAGKASGESRNKSRTQDEQNLNKGATPLEYEYEAEEPVSISSSEKFVNKSIVQDAWSSIPSNRQRGRGKFQDAFIENVVRTVVDVGLVKSALEKYYDSDEGRGKYWRSPATLMHDIIWEEDSSQWSESRGKEESFPESTIDHAKIVKRYRASCQASDKKYQVFYNRLKEDGHMDSEIISRIAYKVWKKYPEYRK